MSGIGECNTFFFFFQWLAALHPCLHPRMVASLVPVLGAQRGPNAPSLAPRDTGSRETLPPETVSCLGALQAGVDPIQLVYVSTDKIL